MCEKLYYLGVKALLHNHKNQYLLLEVNQKDFTGPKVTSYWDLPGGRVQRNESTEETLKREVHEETGLQLSSPVTCLGTYLSPLEIPTKDDLPRGLILSVFLCSTTNESVRLSKEHLNYQWMDVDAAVTVLQHKYPPQFLKDFGHFLHQQQCRVGEVMLQGAKELSAHSAVHHPVIHRQG